MGLFHAVVLGKLEAALQRGINLRGDLAHLGGEAHVAAALCQAVVLAHARALHDIDIKAQLLDHRTDDGNLLEVLLTEVSAVGHHPREQFAHDLAHAVKVTRAHGAFHHLLHRTEVKHAGVGLGIDFLDGGHESHVNATGLEHGGIALGGAGIGAQVFLVVELRGVEEATHHNSVVLLAGTVDERLVTLVKGTHGGHQTY